MIYSILLYLHIASVILSIGPFFVLIPVIGKLRSAQQEVSEAYLEMFRISVRLAKHAGHVLVITGILLVMNSSWSWKTPWIMMTIIILVCSLFFLARAFSPTLRKFSETNEEKEILIGKLKRSTWIYITLLMVMLWFMVTKPTLWQ